MEKIIIVGGVAGGATAAARIRRISEACEITIIEKGPYVSYANCGLPYFISGEIQKRSQLLLQTPDGFWGRYKIQVFIETEAVEINRENKKIKIQNSDGEKWLEYDKCILAQGGNPVIPELPGSNSPNVFKLWNVPDMDRIHDFINKEKPVSAVVVGGGFIGIEMGEAFHLRKLDTTIVELSNQVMATMDKEFGYYAQKKLESSGVKVIAGLGVKSIESSTKEVILSDGRKIPAGIVLFSVGVRPELNLAKSCGLEIGKSGGLLVNEYLQTSDPNIFAAGDMVEILHKVSGKKVRVPLAGPANRQGRIVGTNVLGGKIPYRGSIGTSVVKIFDSTLASTGLSEKAAVDAGFEVGVAIIHKNNHASYYPGSEEITLKLVYDKKNSRVLGAQGFGKSGVEKRIDVISVAIHGKMTLEDLSELDLAYSPPYSSANDPVNMIAFIAENSRSGFSPTVTSRELKNQFSENNSVLLDVRNLGEYSKGHILNSLNIPVDELRFRISEIPKNKKLFVYCRVGFRGHLATRILLQNGFKDVWNVSGGILSILAEGEFEEVKE
ncbi:MAG: FAD-dependent oxidoreductase [Leptospiraceae bacterium]|nr:FAD-dependent oxidoreductase [Leptospiraceae bacterium]MCK6380199.1 FAD-dependent oxidoreductase [Leptospiraceae bacterium]NUM42368.1 FAD-dependent oxidoreductase [Leptospiraceae bacterium]